MNRQFRSFLLVIGICFLIAIFILFVPFDWWRTEDTATVKDSLPKNSVESNSSENTTHFKSIEVILRKDHLPQEDVDALKMNLEKYTFDRLKFMFENSKDIDEQTNLLILIAKLYDTEEAAMLLIDHIENSREHVPDSSGQKFYTSVAAAILNLGHIECTLAQDYLKEAFTYQGSVRIAEIYSVDPIGRRDMSSPLIRGDAGRGLVYTQNTECLEMIESAFDDIRLRIKEHPQFSVDLKTAVLETLKAEDIGGGFLSQLLDVLLLRDIIKRYEDVDEFFRSYDPNQSFREQLDSRYEVMNPEIYK